MDRTEAALLYLMGCALTGQKPDEARALAADQDALRRLACAHKVGALVAEALLQTAGLSAADRDRWHGVQNGALRRSLLFEAERKAIFDWLEQAGIWHVPLKGAVLEALYPRRGLREMADNDVLYDAAARARVRDWFLARGYESHSSTVHDAYYKSPVYNFEMHQSLFRDGLFPAFDRYFKDPLALAEPAAGTRYEYRFRREPFCAYVAAHGFKHYDFGGTGVRFLADLFVMDRALRLDETELHAILNDLELLPFYEQARALAQKVLGTPESFRPEDLSEAERAMLTYLFSSGTYGTMAHRVENSMKKLAGDGDIRKVRGRFLLSRLFPDAAFMRQACPWLEKAPFLLPFAYVQRWGRALLHLRRTRAELDVVRKVK